MITPVERLTKAEIIWLKNNRCKKHSMVYLNHYDCFITEMPVDRPRSLAQRIGFLDIETTDFKADIGNMLTWAIRNYDTSKTAWDVITQKEIIKGTYDKRITKSLLAEMAKYDVLVTYYGTGFDLPFIRTRAVINGIANAMIYGSNINFDLYYIIRRKFKLRRSSLKIATEQLLGETNKTDIDINVWKRARIGDKKALKYVLEHNIADVLDTHRLYNLAVDYRKNMQTSV